MRVEVEHLPESQVQLQIEIDPDALGLAVGRAYQKLAGRYSVPGFRPGKAPRAVLERAIGPEALLTEAADIAINDAYSQAVKEHDLHPLGYPDVQSPKADEIDAQKPLSFTATVYVRPEVQLGDYASIRLAPETPEVTSEDVDAFLKDLAGQQAAWTAVEDGAVEMGDVATLRVLATIDEESLVDQEAWDYQVREGESPNVPIPGLSQRLVGMRKGDVKDDIIDLGDDYVPSSYAGKQLALHVEVLKFERKHAPEIDDSFAQTVAKVDSVAVLRERLTETMQAQARRRALDAYVEKVIEEVVKLSTVSVPPPLVEEELDEMMHQLQDTVERERKISMDTYARILGKTVEQIRTDARASAEQHVRTDLVLDAVAKVEAIEAPDNEIDAQIHLVASQPTYSNKERRRLLASDSLRQRIATKLRKRYVINRLLEIASPDDHGDMAESVESAAQGAPATVVAEQAPESVPDSTSAPATVVAEQAPESVPDSTSALDEHAPSQQNEEEN